MLLRCCYGAAPMWVAQPVDIQSLAKASEAVRHDRIPREPPPADMRNHLSHSMLRQLANANGSLGAASTLECPLREATSRGSSWPQARTSQDAQEVRVSSIGADDAQSDVKGMPGDWWTGFGAE